MSLVKSNHVVAIFEEKTNLVVKLINSYLKGAE